MKRGKSQYSVEFLITYGWALLIIGIILGAIYTFGWLNPGDFLPQKCHFYGQVGCKDFYLSESTFNVSVVNNFGVNLEIKSLTLMVDGKKITQDVDWKDSNVVSWPRGESVKVGVNIPGPSPITEGKRANGIMILQYFSNNTCKSCYSESKSSSHCDCLHNATGNVLVKVVR